MTKKQRPALKPALKVAVVGHADSGTSALIDRLRDHAIIDAPGDREFLTNMASGAAADAAILVVDAANGVDETTRRHAYLLHLFGIRHVAVAVTGMEESGFAEARFAEVAQDASRYLDEIGIAPLAVVPVSARDGDNVTQASGRMPWYEGPSVREALDRLPGVAATADQPLRFPVQDVRKSGERRILSGRVESGVLRAGDTLLFSPSNNLATVRAIEGSNAPAPQAEAHAGESVGITLDEAIFVERGDIASHVEEPPQLTTVFRGTVVWLGRAPLEAGERYTLKLATQDAPVTVQAIDKAIDTDTLAGRAAERVERDGVAEIMLRSRRIVVLDEFRAVPPLGRFALLDGDEVVGVGVVSMEGYPDQRQGLIVKSTNLTAVEHRIGAVSRAQRNGHRGGVMWFTGLSGAGKSTLAMAVEQYLFRKGYHVYVLDGDNVRSGLNANLGFSPDDRAENIRRVGEVAALFADAGFICISAFISPYRADRHRARHAAGKAFHEIFIDADLATCERRDPKGLYKKARAGQIADFTGVSAPYEAPNNPELAIDTAHKTVEACVEEIAAYVERAFALE